MLGATVAGGELLKGPWLYAGHGGGGGGGRRGVCEHELHPCAYAWRHHGLHDARRGLHADCLPGDGARWHNDFHLCLHGRRDGGGGGLRRDGRYRLKKRFNQLLNPCNCAKFDMGIGFFFPMGLCLLRINKQVQ